ncbi:MAG: DUF192 domain-containing protein [Candidatus Colwellbacteria bacterium]|nr:DUF192 domain-containing protein [Candidatus Colwellbacteria bacterium]
MWKAIITIFLLGLIFIVVQKDDMRVLFGDTEVIVEIADTDEKRALGLSGREELKDDHGMLFIFENKHIPGFWMKDMNFAIDIIWIGEDFIVRDITPNLLPETYPQAFYPREPVLYVLEVSAGWAARHNIEVGATLNFEIQGN